eukprot:5857026-Pyramimonas_sp.AAC.1
MPPGTEPQEAQLHATATGTPRTSKRLSGRTRILRVSSKSFTTCVLFNSSAKTRELKSHGMP